MNIVGELFDLGPLEGDRLPADENFRHAALESNSHPVPADLSIEIHCGCPPGRNDEGTLREECRRKSRLIDPDREVSNLLCDLGGASHTEIDAGRASIECALECFPNIADSCRPTVVLAPSEDMPSTLAALTVDSNIREIIVCVDSFVALETLRGALDDARYGCARSSRAQRLTIWAKGNAAHADMPDDPSVAGEILGRKIVSFDAINIVAPLMRVRSAQPGDCDHDGRNCCMAMLRNAADLGMEWVAPGMYLRSRPRFAGHFEIAALDALDACHNGDTLAVGRGATSRIGDTYFVNYASDETYRGDIASGGQGVHRAFRMGTAASLRRTIMSRLASRGVVNLREEAAKVDGAIPAVFAAFEKVLDKLARTRKIVRHSRAVFGLPPGDEIHIGEVYGDLLQASSHAQAIAAIPQRPAAVRSLPA